MLFENDRDSQQRYERLLREQQSKAQIHYSRILQDQKRVAEEGRQSQERLITSLRHRLDQQDGMANISVLRNRLHHIKCQSTELAQAFQQEKISYQQVLTLGFQKVRYICKDMQNEHHPGC